MEVIKAQMLKDEALAPPVAPHAPAHGLNQPTILIATNNSVELKGPRPSSGILRHSGLAAPS